MSASPRVVLVAAAVVASPLVLLLHQDMISLDDAIVRGAIVLAVCWVAISVVHALAFSPTPPPAAAPSEPAPAPVEQPTPAPEY